MNPEPQIRCCSHIDETAEAPSTAIANLTFGDILKMSDVFRWHRDWPRRPQNLAEHSYRVALLAVRLGYELSATMTDALRLAILDLALVHDAPETQDGDVPSPTKWHLREATGINYDEVMDRRFWQDRATIDPWTAAPELAVRLVRVADILEASLFWLRHGDSQDLARGLVHECLAATAQHVPGLFTAVYDQLERGGAPAAFLLGWKLDRQVSADSAEQTLERPAHQVSAPCHPAHAPTRFDLSEDAWSEAIASQNVTHLFWTENNTGHTMPVINGPLVPRLQAFLAQHSKPLTDPYA